MIFDGRKFAKEIEEKVRLVVATLSHKPKIVSILVGNDPASELYTRLKKEAAERVGIEFEVVRLDIGSTAHDIETKIDGYAADNQVDGLMIQLPIPGLQGQTLQELLSAIPLTKDVDGQRWEKSHIIPATVRAILSILDKIAEDPRFQVLDSRIVVLGARGAVGRPLVYFLKKRGVEIIEVEWDTPLPAGSLPEGQVIISCVGKPGIVSADMVKDGIVLIDVGMSQVEDKMVGDMTSEVYQKASFAVPVPGGVGPVTIASLMQNAVNLVV